MFFFLLSLSFRAHFASFLNSIELSSRSFYSYLILNLVSIYIKDAHFFFSAKRRCEMNHTHHVKVKWKIKSKSCIARRSTKRPSFTDRLFDCAVRVVIHHTDSNFYTLNKNKICLLICGYYSPKLPPFFFKLQFKTPRVFFFFFFLLRALQVEINVFECVIKISFALYTYSFYVTIIMVNNEMKMVVLHNCYL